MYVIWSISKSGWVSTSANYTSDLAEAKRYSTRADVISQCAKHSYNKSIDWMPVLLDHLLTIKELIR